MNTLRTKALLSLVLGFLAAFLSWAYLSSRETQLLRRGKMTEVVVANGYLPAYSRIQGRQLQRKLIPAEYVAKGTVTEASDILGELTLVPFNDEEALSYNKLARNGQSLANAVPEGRRAFSIPVDKVRGVNGLLRPGDLVDVLFLNQDDKSAANSKASTLFQNIQVLAAGDLYNDQADKSETGGTVTLALNPEESQLALLALSHGILHLSLRSGGDSRIVSLGTMGAADLLSKLQRHQAAPAAATEDFVIKKR